MEKELPPGFIAIRDILDGGQSNGSLVNVIGFATDFRPPISTRGNGKLALRLSLFFFFWQSDAGGFFFIRQYHSR